MQGEIYQVFTGYAKLDGIIWQLAAAWRHWHEQRAGKEDCLTVLYRKLRPPFTGCFLTTQTTRSDQRLSCQVLSSEEAATNAQGKGTGQGTASSPPRPSQPFGKGLLTLLKVFVLPLPWIIKLKNSWKYIYIIMTVPRITGVIISRVELPACRTWIGMNIPDWQATTNSTAFCVTLFRRMW